ncbi:MAG: hypothetical protein ACJAT2_001862 [Bacteriovoracaceae bacterium]|jgi:hypothetical protein
MIIIRVLALGLLILFSFNGFSEETNPIDRLDSGERNLRKRQVDYHYGYKNRPHSLKEASSHVAAVYGITWVLYPATQPKVFRDKGSFKKYKKNFGKIVFDHDEPFWNWFVHPISGSQLYLFYRANGYNRIDSLGMSFISSTLFELTIEIYTEPASVQDLYQTPVVGSILGLGLEGLSMYLLNTGNVLGKFLGHALNPMTLFWFYEGKVQLIPKYNGKKTGSLTFVMDF